MNELDSALTADDRAVLAVLSAARAGERVAVLAEVLRAYLAAELQVPANEIDADASLATLGLDSLQTLRLRGRLERLLGGEVPLSALWDKDLTALATMLAELLGTREVADGPSDAAPPDSPLQGASDALLPGERLAWYLDQLLAEIPLCLLRVVISVSGPLDVTRLQSAVAAVVARHPALRVRYMADHQGRPTRIHGDPDGAWSLEVHDLRALPAEARVLEAEARIAARAAARIDVARGPLLELVLVCLEDTVHRLLVRAHHINTDGFSLRMMLNELTKEYAAPGSLAASPPAVAPWTVPPRLDLNAARRAAWRERLAAYPLPPPLFHVAPTGSDGYASGVVPFRLTPEVANLLGALSRERGVTLFTTLLAGLFAVLRVATGREDLLIVTPVENRSWPDAERCVGYIANDIVIRVDLAAAPTFEAVLARTWDGLREAWKDEAFSNNSLAHLVHAELGQDPTAFMQVAFFFDEYMRPRPFRSGALEWAPLPLPSRNVTAFRELSLALSRSDDDGIEGALQYKRVAMDDTTASAFAHAYAELMADVATGLTADPSLLAMRSPAGDGHAQLATLQATVDAWQRPLTEVAAAFVLAGAPDVRPLSELRDMVTPPLNVAMRKKG